MCTVTTTVITHTHTTHSNNTHTTHIICTLPITYNMTSLCIKQTIVCDFQINEMEWHKTAAIQTVSE